MCYEVSDPNRVIGVVIENQLRMFDHSHLGQAQTYTREFDAGICVTIATNFRPEHLAVFEELNSKTGREVNYYCVKVSAVRIGDSPPAALFDLALGPDHRIPSNLRTVPQHLNEIQADPVPKRRARASSNSTQEFLEELRKELATRYHRTAIRGKPYTFLRFNLGPGPARFSIERGDEEQGTRVRLYIRDRALKHKTWYQQLKSDQDAIHQELGEPADWKSNQKRSAIDVSLPSSIRDMSDRDLEIKWCVSTLLKYDEVFVDRLKILRNGGSIVPRTVPPSRVPDAA